MLPEIRRFLLLRGRATLRDIATHLEAEPFAVRGMLEVWARKGRIRRTPATSACGSACTRCDAAVVEIYEWVGASDDVSSSGVRPFDCSAR